MSGEITKVAALTTLALSGTACGPVGNIARTALAESPTPTATVDIKTLVASGISSALTGTAAPSITPTASETPKPPTFTPTKSSTPQPTRTPAGMIGGAGRLSADTATFVPSPTNTLTNTAVATGTPMPSASFTATAEFTPPPSITPSRTPTAPTTETPTAVATASSSVDSITRLLNGYGINIEIPRIGWPMTPEEAVNLLKAQSGVSVDAAHLVRVMDVNPNTGAKTWRGWWMGEPAFPMRSNIKYDSSLHVHIDQKTNKPEFDPIKIFVGYDELTPEQKKKFVEGFSGSQGLINIKINQPGIAVFARKGGEVLPGDLEKNTQFFFGTVGAKVEGVEQLSIIPVPQELCESDVELSGATRSFRQAVVEFRDNKAVQEGQLTVKWFNPETNKFETLDGRMLIKLSKQGVDISVLERMPANTPLSPEDMSKRFGGQAEKWVVNPKTWEWFYEAYEFQPGVRYVAGVGAVDQNGQLLFGAEQANSATSKVFDFSRLDTDALAQRVNAPGSFQATLFARQGTMGDPATKNHSWYTFGEGNITLKEPGIEQMTFMPHNPEWCSPRDIPNQLAARAKTLATEQPDKAVTALFWDSSKFVQVIH